MQIIDPRKPLRAREWSYTQLLHCFSSSWFKRAIFAYQNVTLIRGFHGNYFFDLTFKLCKMKGFGSLIFFITYRPTENTFQNVLDFFSPVFGTSVRIFSVKSPTLTSHIEKDTKKTLKKSKSHIILNFTAFSENLEIRYCNTLANLYLKTFHWLWDYQQQPPYQLAYWIIQQELSISSTYWTTSLHPLPHRRRLDLL